LVVIGWFSNRRDDEEIVAGIATVVASAGGSLTQSISQSISQSLLLRLLIACLAILSIFHHVIKDGTEAVKLKLTSTMAEIHEKELV